MHILIIGNGIAGITAARHIRKRSNHKITVLSSESKYFYSRTALMYIYMGHLKQEHTQPYEPFFWKKNRIDLILDRAEIIDFDSKEVFLKSKETIRYDKLILALGSTPNKFGWPGQDLDGVQGLYSLQDLQKLEENTIRAKRTVIVGGGLIGIELAEMMLSRSIEVTFLVRENSFWDIVLPKEESEMINRHIREHHIDLRLNTELKQINPDNRGRVASILTNQDEEIECQIVGLTAGVHPNIDFVRTSKLEIERGILVDSYLQTNIKDVYAIGDCAELRKPPLGRRSIEAVWYTGKMMGETVAATICDRPTKYAPGHWFNSAKFLDIEYQTYGHVSAIIKEDEDQFYWEHKNGKKAFRASYEVSSGRLKGINAMGMRLSHSLINQWLHEGKSINYAIEHIKSCNFDPEFSEKNEKQIQEAFAKHNLSTIK